MKKRKIVIWISSVVFALLLLGGVLFYEVWNIAFRSNFSVPEGEIHLYIPTGATFQTLEDSLTKRGNLLNINTFRWLAQKKRLTERVPAGRYKIVDGANNLAVIDKIRSGAQDPVHLIFNNINTAADLATSVSKQIEATESELLALFSDDELLRQYGVTSATLFTIIIPNTYQFYWNSSATSFLDRMKKESDRFWNADRQALAKKIQLTRNEVVTLASIVEKETSFQREKPIIAGVYMNRLRSNWLLQADPTVKFAVGDPTLKRILYEHLEIDSPYNTYKYAGLPPGPICMPSISSIDGVLNYERNSYYFFCAKPDLTGHVFSRTLREHQDHARRFQRAQYGRGK